MHFEVLIRVKQQLPHGAFLPWIEAEFSTGRTAAHRFMTVAERYAGKCSSVQHLDSSALYELASPSTPPEDRAEIGLALIRVKQRLPHDSFLPWIDAEFSMGEHTARRFMNVAERFGSKSSTMLDLTPTALYELYTASPEVRAEVEARAAAGEKVSAANRQRLPIWIFQPATSSRVLPRCFPQSKIGIKSLDTQL